MCLIETMEEKYPSLFVLLCGDHSLDLLLGDFYKKNEWVKDTVDSMRDMVTFIRNHHKPQAQNRILSCQLLEDLKSIKNTELSTARRDVLVAQAEERWLYFDHPLHRAAYALDPEHQKHDWHTDTFVTEALEDCLERYYGNDAEALASAERQIEQYRNREGRFARSACVQNMELMSSWSWWAKYGGSIPELQQFAMDVLSLVAGACSCERNWSAYDFIHSKKRNKLSAEKCEELVYIFSNLRLLRKLTAGD